MPSIAGSSQPAVAARPPHYPARITLVSRSDETVRPLEAYICNAGVSSNRLAEVELDQLLAPDTLAAVVFVDGFALSYVLTILKTLHSQRPGLPLVFIAGYAARFTLWQAFRSWAPPPLVLHGSASA